MRTIASAVFLLLLATATAAVELAPPGEIRAVIVDEKGKPIPGVTVSLIAEHSTVTPELRSTPPDGVVTFKALDPGDYLLRCAMAGFFTITVGPIPIRYDKHVALPRLLKISMVAGPIQY